MTHRKLKSCIVASIRKTVSFRRKQKTSIRSRSESEQRNNPKVEYPQLWSKKTKQNYTKQKVQAMKGHMALAVYRWKESGRGQQSERGWAEKKTKKKNRKCTAGQSSLRQRISTTQEKIQPIQSDDIATQRVRKGVDVCLSPLLSKILQESLGHASCGFQLHGHMQPPKCKMDVLQLKG